jgi:DNA-binding NarL/FixJ family response regulator
MTTKLMIADDHWVVRHALRCLLAARDDMEIVAEASDGEQAIALAQEFQPDLVILDISLPIMSGMQVLEAFRQRKAAPHFLVFSMHPPDQYIKHVQALGARGFVSKDSPANTIIQAIDTILGGRLVFPAAPVAPGELGAKPYAKVIETLSKREDEVLRALIQGERNGDIAKRLNISAKTVSTYRARIFEKLNVQSNAELVTLTASIAQYQ